MFSLRCALVFFCLALLYRASSQNFGGGFNFYLPADDSSTQLFLPAFPARDITSFIGIDERGHFSREGNPIRFWGVNLTTGSCFPVKEKSAFIAARMRKMGINLVRFHHMDNGWSGNDGTIFLRNSGNTRSLDPVALDRLMYFLSQMKRNAIYANINLHVSRTFLEGDGVEDADSIWQFAKGITYFDPQLIDLQKEFAHQLLTADNPYTGLALYQDPVIAMVEITNENTLYGMWKGDQLKTFSTGGNLMRRHAAMLDDLWQNFLIDKYGNDTTLTQAWGGFNHSGSTDNQIQNGDFENGDIAQQWQLELHENAQATMAASNHAFNGNFAVRVDVTRVTNTSWHIQFKQTGLSMEKDSAYVLEFYAQADRTRQLNAAVQRDNDPWTWYGGQSFNLSTNWRHYRLSITAPEDNQRQVRITFNFANETGPVWFDDVSFSKPQSTGLEPNLFWKTKIWVLFLIYLVVWPWRVNHIP